MQTSLILGKFATRPCLEATRHTPVSPDSVAAGSERVNVASVDNGFAGHEEGKTSFKGLYNARR